MIPFLRLTDTTAPLADELKAAAARVIDSGWYLNGPETKAFEKELAASVESKLPAVGTSNGLDALRLIFRGLLELGKLSKGDEVLVPANTYIASILPLTEFGLTPVLVEPDEQTLCMSADDASCRITRHTRAMLVVHLYGNPCWNEELRQLVEQHDLILIEDNAQAIGAKSVCPGKNGTASCGNLGDASAFSFYPTKNIGALGDAGAVVTPHAELSDAIRALANYGSDRRYHNVYQGYNCRIDELQAAFLRIKLARLDAESDARNAAAEIYSREIDNQLVIKPALIPGTRQVWHQYPVHIKAGRRDEFREYLQREGVGTDIHYATPPHLQPCYADGAIGTQYPVTERLAQSEVSLPIANISPEQASAIAKIINKFS